MIHPPNDKIERRVPWQLWVVVIMLSLEGVSNLLAIPDMPVAAYWLAAKILFVWGFIRGWRLVFVLFLVVAAFHVQGFSSSAPFVAFLNLVLMILVASAYKHFFPPPSRQVRIS